jgi:hypothetical protein
MTIAMSGCVPQGPKPSTTSSSSSGAGGGAFSRDSALAAAQAAYLAYLATEDLVASDGGENPERMSSVASGLALDASLKDLAELRDAGLKIVGETRLSSIEVQQWDRSVITAYICEDVSAIDLIDASGVSKVNPDRPAVTPFEVTFSIDNAEGFLVSERNPWAGKTFCA